MAEFATLRNHPLPGLDAPIEHLLIGPMGVFVVAVTEPASGRRARHAQQARLRREQRAVRERLDAVGLRALPAVGIASDDLGSVVEHAKSDVRFGPSTVQAARLALDPPPFVATVAEAPRSQRPMSPGVPTGLSRYAR